MAMIVLLVLSSTIVFSHHYLARQRFINNQIRDHFLAEGMVEMSNGQPTKFNLGTTHRISQTEWQVRFNNGKRIRVTQ